MRLLITDHKQCEEVYRSVARRNRVRFEAALAVEANMAHYEFTGDEPAIMTVVSDLGLDQSDIDDETVSIKEN
jgi:hypothetical protein